MIKKPKTSYLLSRLNEIVQNGINQTKAGKAVHAILPKKNFGK